MFDTEMAKDLSSKGLQSNDELTNTLGRYLNYALDSIQYYKDYIKFLKKGDK